MNRIRTVACLLVACFAARHAWAQPLRGTVDTQRSRVYIKVGAKGFGHEHGAEARLTRGLVHLGAEQQAGELLFDMHSFVCDTAESRRVVGLTGEIDEGTRTQTTVNMLGPEVLDVARFPTAKFTIQSARALQAQQAGAGQPYELDGSFTLHGVTQPLKFVAIAESTQGWIRLRGQFKFLQSKYRMKPYSRAFGAIGVADELIVIGDLWVAP
ncbi:MAG TPA: YceI family protein [Pirellulales bacterium]|nr:YceI family protein [Pirellulales bacterium]